MSRGRSCHRSAPGPGDAEPPPMPTGPRPARTTARWSLAPTLREPGPEGGMWGGTEAGGSGAVPAAVTRALAAAAAAAAGGRRTKDGGAGRGARGVGRRLLPAASQPEARPRSGRGVAEVEAAALGAAAGPGKGRAWRRAPVEVGRWVGWPGGVGASARSPNCFSSTRPRDRRQVPPVGPEAGGRRRTDLHSARPPLSVPGRARPWMRPAEAISGERGVDAGASREPPVLGRGGERGRTWRGPTGRRPRTRARERSEPLNQFYPAQPLDRIQADGQQVPLQAWLARKIWRRGEPGCSPAAKERTREGRAAGHLKI